MKIKSVVSLLAVAILLGQGLAFAEITKDVTAKAEDVVAAGSSVNSVAEKSVNDVMKAPAVTEELVTPAPEPVKDAAQEAKETPKM